MATSGTAALLKQNGLDVQKRGPILLICQNDVFLGARFALNDEDGTEVLTGITQDLDNSDVYSAKLEASSRINNNLKWRLNAWLFEPRVSALYLCFFNQSRRTIG